MPQMTKGEREELSKLIRAQANIAKKMAEQRAAELLADGEEQLAKKYRVDDEAWSDLTAAANAAVRKADGQLAKRCEEMHIPPEFRPKLYVNWSQRGENALADRRAELRRVLKTKVEAVTSAAMVQIEMRMVEGLTMLAQDGLESSAAQAFLAGMPTVQELMPKLDVEALPESRKSAA
jgi:Tfp pilus assembly protein PilX